MASGEYLFYENEKPIIQEISRTGGGGGGKGIKTQVKRAGILGGGRGGCGGK